jgi:hypothetical protein
MEIQTIQNNDLKETPADSTELLRHILEDQNIFVSYEDAFEIGQSLIDLCEAFIEDSSEMEQTDDGG